MSNRRRTWENAFFAALEKTGVVAWAAKAAGVGRRTVYDHLQADPEFGERWQEALDTAADTLEGELIRRAVEGEQVPVYYKGKVVGHKTRKSDTLLMFAIKNLQRRREQEVRKTSSLNRIFGVGGSLSRRRIFAPDAEDAGDAEATVMEGLADQDETAPVHAATAEPSQAATVEPPEAPFSAACRRPRGRPQESGAKDRKRRRGAWRWWPRWSPLPVYARALWRPLLA